MARAQPPARKREQRPEHDFNAGANVGLFGLFQLVIGPPPGSGRLDHIVNDLAQECRDLLGKPTSTSGALFEVSDYRRGHGEVGGVRDDKGGRKDGAQRV